ncbi:hypothetical protein HG530_001831 [Fusarium avenaceum]|nr:hypothetical protein HG530_001831 [Fusarium avenaceum]
MDAEDATSPTKLVIHRAKVDLLDTELSQERSTHDARFYGNIKNALPDNRSVDPGVGMDLLPIRVEVSLGTIFVALVRRSRIDRRRIRSRSGLFLRLGLRLEVLLVVGFITSVAPASLVGVAGTGTVTVSWHHPTKETAYGLRTCRLGR